MSAARRRTGAQQALNPACAILFCIGSSASAGIPGEATAPPAGSVPAGFESLLEPQQAVADVYFGGRLVGQARITHQPGTVLFADAPALVAQLASLKNPEAVKRALMTALQSNSSLICSDTHSSACGRLAPAVAGIIYDEDKFRIDLFVNPDLLELQEARGQAYIAPPSAHFSLASTFSAALAGTLGGRSAFNLQTRTIASYGSYRVRSDAAFSFGRGLSVDTLVGETDRGSLRYSAGIFWAPSIDFVGDRKLIGAAVSTQYDTLADKEMLRSTPIVVFLPQPAFVEILREGRLLSSERRDAGNHALDTAALPDGSYEVVLRIQEAGGGVREERRLFFKNRQMVPAGRPFLFAQAGFLTNGHGNVLPEPGNGIFLQAGAAKRVTRDVAVDATLISYRGNVIGQVGLTALTRHAQVRGALLGAAQGQHGALLQVNSSGAGAMGFNFDLRRIWSRNDRPLVALTVPADTMASHSSSAVLSGAGAYAQASGNLALRLGRAELALLASYRKDRRGHSYTVGPRLDWNIVQHGSASVSLYAELTHSDRTQAAYVGLRVQTTRARSAVSGSVGMARLSRSGTASDGTDLVGQLSGTIQRTIGSSDVALEAAFEHSLETSVVRGGARALGRFGLVNAELQHDLGSGATQYSANFRTAAAVTSRALAWGGRETSDSGIIVGVEGQAASGAFEVLIDDVPRGQLSAGGRLAIFLAPYREYSVRLRPMDAPKLSFDSTARTVSLYPGNVQPLAWTVEPVFTTFGRAVLAGGRPAANADVTTGRGIGRTDPEGYFQVEAGANEAAVLKLENGETCSIDLTPAAAGEDYVSLGTVLCR